jgi:hypothetical protein
MNYQGKHTYAYHEYVLNQTKKFDDGELIKVK